MKSKQDIKSNVFLMSIFSSILFIATSIFFIINLWKDLDLLPFSDDVQYIYIGIGLVVAIVSPLSRLVTKKIDPKINSIAELVDETPTRVVNAMAEVVPMKDMAKDTEFSFLRMAELATKSIFIIGPNLHYFVREPAVKKLLARKLRQPGFRIRILIIDRDSTEICQVMSKFALTDGFIPELEESTKMFKQWNENFKNSRFQARKTDVVTMALLFIDENDMDYGRLLVTPIPWKVRGGDRPSFLIQKKKNAYAFKTYLNAYTDLFRESKAI